MPGSKGVGIQPALTGLKVLQHIRHQSYHQGEVLPVYVTRTLVSMIVQ